jgi:hypothetical protein
MNIREMTELAKKHEHGILWFSSKGPIYIAKDGEMKPAFTDHYEYDPDISVCGFEVKGKEEIEEPFTQQELNILIKCMNKFFFDNGASPEEWKVLGKVLNMQNK